MNENIIGRFNRVCFFTMKGEIEMKKQLKKALAVVCAVAMVVAGITVVPNSVKADTNYSSLTYTKAEPIGAGDFPELYYSFVTNELNANVGYLDAGATFQFAYSADNKQEDTKITVNGVETEPGAGVVSTYTQGLTKLNPKAMADNAYTDVVITSTKGKVEIVFKKGTPATTSTDVTQPDASSADVSQPDASSADVSQPDASSADVSQPDVSTPDVSTPDASTPDASTPDETTTPKPTTAKPTVKPTTAKPTTKKASLKKTKITKKITKKLSSKKVKLTFKKVKGAKKYTVQVSTSKKFKKVLYKKTVKKTKVTLSSKKLKNKKKLYVRVKAVGAKKWSKPVAIKIKK